MKVFNIRFGLATNSSSTHSLIFFKEKDGEEYKDTISNGEFNWGFWIASSKKQKDLYLAIILQESLRKSLPENIANLISNEWLEQKIWIDLNWESDDFQYIDHQSLHILPHQFNSGIADEQFFKEFKEFILQPSLAILGGNDNDSPPSPLFKKESFRLPFVNIGRNNWVCRKDEKYNYWVLFNQYDGTKIRFQFVNDPKNIKEIPDKAYAPELIDLKITDYCDNNCPHCYMDSGPNGKHADDRNTYTLSKIFGKLKIFEVAIGGGEPTLHPEFINILKDFKQQGVTPNFSTKKLDWIRDDKRRNEILDNCGAFAYSLGDSNSIGQMKEFISLVNYYKIPEEKLGVQLIPELMPYQLQYVLKLAALNDIRITLLGFKKVGRGADPKYNDLLARNGYTWIEVIKNILKSNDYLPNIGIDTCLAERFSDELKEMRVSDLLYTTQEGKFSAYIDAVNMKMGPSSFCNKEDLKEIDLMKTDNEICEDIINIFNNF